MAFSLDDVAQAEANLRAARVRAVAREAPDTRNKTEREYGARLEARKLAGEIVSYAYEAVTLKLAFDLRYTPDYLVICADGTVEFHECKGAHIWDDGRDKLKTAARLFPWFVFFRAQKKDGRWTVREVKTW